MRMNGQSRMAAAVILSLAIGAVGSAEGLGRSGRLAVAEIVASYDLEKNRMTLTITSSDGIEHEYVTDDSEDVAPVLAMVESFASGRLGQLFVVLEEDEVVALQVEVLRRR